MPWLRLDDAFAHHPKVIGLSDAAFRLHVSGLVYAARHLTDGVIPAAALPALYPTHTRRTVNELLEADLWHATDHTCPTCPPVTKSNLLLHDYLAYNPTAAEAKAAADSRSRKASRAANKRWRDAPSNAPSIAQASPEHMLQPAPYPSPSNPPNPPQNRTDQLLDYVANQLTEKASTRQPDRYRQRQRRNLEQQRQKANQLTDEYPTAPLDSLAAALLGEPSGGLAFHRKKEPTDELD